MPESSKTRVTGLTVATAAVASSLTSAFIGYFSGDVKTTGTNIAATHSGAQLVVNAATTDTGAVIAHGADGAHLCIFDTDAAGWSSCDTLNGTMTCRIASAGQCP